MKNKILIGFLLLAGALGYAWYLYSKPTEKTISADAELSITAAALYNDYTENEAAANQKYLNKVIRVNGIISGIESNDSMGLNITLETGDELGGVNCQVPEPKNGHVPKVGDVITLKGLCTGVLMDVVIARCSIEKNSTD